MEKEERKDLGDEMKALEGVSKSYLNTQQPVIVRLDGKGFSQWTKKLAKPFDFNFTQLMIQTTNELMRQTGADVGYTQSDEITLIFYIKDAKQQLPFKGSVQKYCSIYASIATAYFNENRAQIGKNLPLAYFDARCFNVPDLSWALKTLIWRQRDAYKNAISMAARSRFSTKQMEGKSGLDKIQMLQTVGVDFASYPESVKTGTFALWQINEEPIEVLKDRLSSEVWARVKDNKVKSVVRRVLVNANYPGLKSASKEDQKTWESCLFAASVAE